ncbi:helix-turn-helix domain-containing protein [Bacteroides uniformis]|uniref:helix-turn-helix domain-containing protein n=1 Tax=Bacteroides uniformis TaxID=820 RepID=UPI0021658B77|nr:helix-turn-helix domain-containing protein [Bacteroides uniformis]MCS3352239.1 helix-turn-helix domain-containing protein [Bacteroides uniformis]
MRTHDTQSLALSHGEQYKHGRTSLRELLGKLPFVANGCTMLLCAEGRAIIVANARKYTFRKGDLLVLFSDTLFTPLCISSSFVAEYISVSLDLTEDIFYKMTSAAFWDGLYEYPVCRLSEAHYILADGAFKQMVWAMGNGDEESRKNILQNCIYNVFLALDIVFKSMFPDIAECYQKDQPRMLFGKFMSLLTKNFHEKRDVKYYADRLCITTDYLYKVTSKIEHRTPKEIIDLFVATELKRYLDNTELSVKDLARLFHFEDASYLCRFFRRMAGCSISEYRNRLNRL